MISVLSKAIISGQVILVYSLNGHPENYVCSSMMMIPTIFAFLVFILFMLKSLQTTPLLMILRRHRE